MKEIRRFRGIRFDNGTWAYGDLISDTYGTIIQYFSGGKRVKVFVDPDTVGQYVTAVKNHLAVYEGDIIKTPEGVVGAIEYCNAVRAYKAIDWTNHMNDISGDSERIGNVFENPELVEEAHG